MCEMFCAKIEIIALNVTTRHKKSCLIAYFCIKAVKNGMIFADSQGCLAANILFFQVFRARASSCRHS